MHSTRHPARSSFTFEIKRANRRAPEVLTLSKKPSGAGPSLIDQVFGTLAGTGPASEQISHPLPASRSSGPQVASPGDAVPLPSPDRCARRILPDLLVVEHDPVAERIKQEVEERAARRAVKSKPRTSRPVRTTVAQCALPDDGVDNAEAPAQANRTVPPAEADPDQGTDLPALPRRKRQTEIKVPAGQRWKRRRLPSVCW
jgi:hypothetical protein